MKDAVVDMTPGDCGRCIVDCSPYDELGGGMLNEVRELLKDWRRLVRPNRRRTPPGRRPGDVWEMLVLGVGERQLAAPSRLLSSECIVVSVWLVLFSRSGSGVGGRAPGMGIISFVGCELSGPPPAVGGLERVFGRDRRTLSTGDSDTGGESSGAGMLVPDVREKSTGRTDKLSKVCDLRLSSGSAGMLSAVPPKLLAADRPEASNVPPRCSTWYECDLQ